MLLPTLLQIQPNRTFVIAEGGDPYEIEYEVLVPPATICGADDPCDVYIEWDLELGTSPRLAHP